MGKIWTQNDIHTGRDVTRIVASAGCETRNGKGSHRVTKLPDGTVLTYYDHGEFPPGMRHHVIKALKAAGLIMLLTFWLYLIFGV